MKLLITGGLGFIGSNFIRYILNKYKNYQVINLDKMTYASNPENLRDIENDPRYKFIKGDICDKELVNKLVSEEKPDVIINFAAETHVDRSILEPDAFIKTDILGAYTLLEAVKRHDINRFLQVSCYDEKTQALTTEGLKTYKELKKSDKVFSLNPITQEIEVKPIEKIIIQSYRGEMVHFKNQRIDLMVTPNHNMFILNTKKKLVVETAEKAYQRSIFYFPEGHWRGKNKKEYFNIKNHGRVRVKDLMYILGIFIGDGFIAYQEKEVDTKTGLPREQFLRQSRDKKSGRFKEIKKQGNYRSKCHSYRIFFDIPQKDKCRKKVERTLSNLGIKYSAQKGKAGEHLYFTSKVWLEFFSQCGKGASNKHIPRWALDYPPEYLKYLLEGLIDSDGYNNKIYHTVSKRLVSDICELCIKLNLKPSIHLRHTKSFIGGRKIEGSAYYIFIARTTKSISRHRIKLVNYGGKVWCLKIKDNRNFIVERGGRFDFCGNTDEVYGSIEKGKFTEQSPIKTNSPYSASKAGADLLVLAYFKTYNLPVLITRSSNNYGPFQYPEKLIPLFITNLLEDKKVPLYGDGLNIRDWLYVLDNCKAIDLVLHKGEIGEIYNIGANNEKTNKEITEIILKELGKDKNWIEYVKDRPGHDRRYALNSKKIRKLGWKPEYDFKKAIKETTDWYKDNQSWWKKIKSGEFLEYYKKQYKNI